MPPAIPKPLIQKVNCVRFYVPDLESGLAFYRDRLGHELIWRTDTAVGLRLPDTDAEIDLKVRSADKAAAHVEAAGGTIVEPPFDIQIGRCTVVQDPWGNEFVLLDASKGLLVTDEEGHIIGNAVP